MRVAKYFVYLAIFMLTGCAQVPAVIDVPDPSFAVPKPDPIKLHNGKVFVITPDSDSVGRAFKLSGSDILIGQTPDDWRLQLNNQSQLIRVIRQQKTTIKSMQRYYEHKTKTAN